MNNPWTMFNDDFGSQQTNDNLDRINEMVKAGLSVHEAEDLIAQEMMRKAKLNEK